MSYYHRLKGAVKSKKKAAYLGLFLYAASPFTRLFDSVFSILFFKKHESKKPLLIILSCPPRSGSTVLFQYLTRELKVNYPSNVHFLFPKIGSRLYKWLKVDPSKWKGFNNYYGYTPHFGDVNEGNYFFNQIENKSDGELELEIQTFVSSMSNNGQPILCKTVSSYSFLSRIYNAYPNSLFIRVTRELSQNIQSELAAYYELKSFNPIPKVLRNINFNVEPAKFASRQIKEMNTILDREFGKIPSQHSLVMPYESFCENPNDFIDLVNTSSIALGGVSLEKRGYRAYLKASDRKKVEQKDIKIIEMEIGRNV